MSLCSHEWRSEFLGPLTHPIVFNLAINVTEQWATSSLIEHFGNLTLGTTVRRSPYTIARYLHASKSEIGHEQLFSGSDGVASLAAHLLKSLRRNLPKGLRQLDARHIVSIGQLKTGSLLHRHDASWLFLAQGRKDWLLLPPHLTPYALHHLTKEDPCSLRDSVAALGGTECVQHAGEIVFLPANTWHATCNLESNSSTHIAVAIGAQGFKQPSHALLYAARDGDLESIRETCDRDLSQWFVPGPWFRRTWTTMENAWIRFFRRRPWMGPTALHVAAQHNQLGAVEILLSSRCRAHWMVHALAKPSGAQPLYEAARCGSPGVLQLLLRVDPTLILQVTEPDHVSPLHVAARYGHLGATEILLKAKAEINARTVRAETALHFVAEVPQLPILKLLLSHRADSLALDAAGRTVAHVALEAGHGDVLSCLLAQDSKKGREELTLLAKTPLDRRGHWNSSVLHELVDDKTEVGKIAINTSLGKLPSGLLLGLEGHEL